MRHRPRPARDEILWDMDRDMTLRVLFVAPDGGMVSAAWRRAHAVKEARESIERTLRDLRRP